MAEAAPGEPPRTPSAAERDPGSAGVFVGRPILALVINLLVIIAGLAALRGVEVRELPNVSQPVVSVRASYPGASPSTVDAEVTSVLEDALARLEGLDSISATSSYGSSRLTLYLSSATDSDVAANDVRELVSGAARSLPDGLEDPTVSKSDADADPILRLALTGDLPLVDLTELAENMVSDRLQAIEGVAEVEVAGGYDRVFRVTFAPLDLASHGISVVELREALSSANLDLPLGSLETASQTLIVRSAASAATVDAISAIRLNRETVVGDIAFVQLTSDDNTQISRVNGHPSVGLNVIRQSLANTLTISVATREAVEDLQEALPTGTELIIVSDDGVFVERSLSGVVISIGLAIIIVVVVIFLFLRSLRAVVVPATAVPIALIGTLAAIWGSGFSVNTITLLALVLATGMVVDDAIVVLENIVRRRRDGLGAYAAAAVGTRQVFFAVISTTAVLAAVFIPISFLPGQAGGVFAEFGFVLAFAVALSSFVALTLCPVVCALFDPGGRGRLASHGEPGQSPAAALFGSVIDVIIRWRFPVVIVALAFAAAAMVLYTTLPQEITPDEDRGSILISLRTPVTASLDYTNQQVEQVEAIIAPLIASGEALSVQALVRGTNSAFVIVRLALWEDRDRSQQDIVAEIQEPLSQIPGALASVRSSNSLGIRGAGQGLQFAVVGNDFDRIGDLATALVEAMAADPTFANPQLDNEINQPQLQLDIDREEAANLGIEPRDVITTLSTMIEGDTAADVFVDNEALDIELVPGGRPVNDQGELENVFIKSSSGQFVPLSAVAELSQVVSASTLTREERQPAVTGRASLGMDVELSTAAARLAEIAPAILGDGGRLIFLGEAESLESDYAGTLIVFGVAILIVLLVLAAQFESLTSALIILITVPAGLGTALLAIFLTGGSLNYYSQIGLLLLVGIMAKNGILIVEFANQLRQRGRDVDQAIREAVRIRLRPVLMTMASTVAGSIPLVVASGAGAEARIAVGWVVVGGLGLATIFTLFLTPAVYRILAPIGVPPGGSQRRLAEELAAD
ncbi:efflux RND transporter permease subunit [Bauldia sp.]|uniref:efflux RND transporter permease subunit n=1 Tax=Bauldia sp. TaxID=2575872 RepID=UPI003BADAFA7